MGRVDSEHGWAQVHHDLGVAIDGLRPDQALTVGVCGTGRFVRATRRHCRLRLEAVGNGHLPRVERLDAESLDLLQDLTWRAPTHFADSAVVPRSGSTNHFIDLEPDRPGRHAASLLVRTLRGVFEVGSAGDLVWRRTARGCTALDTSTDGSLDDVVVALLDGLRSFTTVDTVASVDDTDGIVRIAAGGEITVLYDARHRFVRATVPVVSRFPATAQSLSALHECARPMRCGRLDLRDGTVVAVVDLPAEGPVGPLLVAYLDSVRANLGQLRSRLLPFTVEV